MEAVVYRWDSLPTDKPMPMLERRRIIGERMMLSRVILKKGCDVPMHAHENEQLSVIVSGRLRFGIGGKDGQTPAEVIVSAGEVIHLPSNLPHSAYALEDTLVLDLFSPPSEKSGIDRK